MSQKRNFVVLPDTERQRLNRIPMKYRAICPVCHKPYDMRFGYLVNGHLVCIDCVRNIISSTRLQHDEKN